MNLEKIIKIIGIISLGISCTKYQKINEGVFNGCKVELYKSPKNEFKLVIKEPREHVVFRFILKDAVIRTFYFDEKFNLKKESVDLPLLGEGYGYNKENIPSEDKKKALDYLRFFMKDQ